MLPQLVYVKMIGFIYYCAVVWIAVAQITVVWVAFKDRPETVDNKTYLLKTSEQITHQVLTGMNLKYYENE